MEIEINFLPEWNAKPGLPVTRSAADLGENEMSTWGGIGLKTGGSIKQHTARSLEKWSKLQMTY